MHTTLEHEGLFWKRPQELLSRRRDFNYFRAAFEEAIRQASGDYIIPGQRILEVGAGVDPLITYLPKAYGANCVVTDYNSANLEAAQMPFTLERRVASIYNLPFADNSMDAIMGMDVLNVLSKPQDAFKEMQRVLVPGGHMIHFNRFDPLIQVIISHNPGYIFAPQIPFLDEEPQPVRGVRREELQEVVSHRSWLQRLQNWPHRRFIETILSDPARAYGEAMSKPTKALLMHELMKQAEVRIPLMFPSLSNYGNRKLAEAAIESGFRLILNDRAKATVTLDRQPRHNGLEGTSKNTFTYNVPTPSYTHDERLSGINFNLVRESVSIGILVFQKLGN